MQSRFTASLLHALIHVGHGLGFGLKGLVVEGLVLAAVQDVDEKDSYPTRFFIKNTHLTTEVDTHVFDIIAHLIRDGNLEVENVQVSGEFKQAVDEHRTYPCKLLTWRRMEKSREKWRS